MLFWFTIAAILLIIELFIGTIYLLVLSAALFGAGLAQWLFTSTIISVLTAALLAAIGIWWANHLLQQRKQRPSEHNTDDLDIGQSVQIMRHLHTNQYEVLYRGAQWQAQALNTNSEPTPQSAMIVGKQGNILLIHLH